MSNKQCSGTDVVVAAATTTTTFAAAPAAAIACVWLNKNILAAEKEK